MRLLDHIAQSSEPFLVRQTTASCGSSPARPSSHTAWWAVRCAMCYPTSSCAPARLSPIPTATSCPGVWICCTSRPRRSGSSGTRARAARRWPASCLKWTAAGGADAVRAGALISARPAGRAGSLRTFWLTRGEAPEAVVAPVETLLDFDGVAANNDADALLGGSAVTVRDPHNPQSDELLQCAAFRFDSAWQRYYQHIATDAQMRTEVIRRSLAAVASDVPMLLALFLLLAVRRSSCIIRWIQCASTPSARGSAECRCSAHRVSAPLFAQAERWHGERDGNPRRGPRLHHVRGHLVRRRKRNLLARPALARSRASRQRAQPHGAAAAARLGDRAGTARGGRGSGG